MLFKKRNSKKKEKQAAVKTEIKRAQKEISEFRQKEEKKREQITAEGGRERDEIERQKHQYLDLIDKQYDNAVSSIYEDDIAALKNKLLGD